MNWISVKEKLPEMGEHYFESIKGNIIVSDPVLVYKDGSSVMYGYFQQTNEGILFCHVSEDKNALEDYDYTLDEISHWMPLPAPAKKAISAGIVEEKETVLDDLECDRLEGVISDRNDPYMEIIEPDENGVSVVYKDGVVYYKITKTGHNSTTHLYIPAFMYKDIYKECQKKRKQEEKRKRQEKCKQQKEKL